MNQVDDIIAAADSPMALFALFLLGLYVLLWKYGGELLKLLRKNVAQTQGIASDIVTNHGSKNIGDAIDRLTTEQRENAAKMVQVVDKVDDIGREQASLAVAVARGLADLRDYIEVNEDVIAFGRARMNELSSSGANPPDDEGDGST